MSNPTELPDVDYDKDMDRHYIPLPGGWEIHTKGKGSTFRIAHIGSGRRWMVLDDQLHDPLVALANAVREALARRAKPEGEAPQADVEAAAKAIYELLPPCQGVSAKEYLWQAGGNSRKQDEAREYARAALATLSPLCGAQHAESGALADELRATLLELCEARSKLIDANAELAMHHLAAQSQGAQAQRIECAECGTAYRHALNCSTGQTADRSLEGRDYEMHASGWNACLQALAAQQAAAPGTPENQKKE